MRCVINLILVIVLVFGSARAVLAEAVQARIFSVDPKTHDTVLQATESDKKWSLSGPEIQKIAGRSFDQGDFVAVVGDPPAAGSNVSLYAVSVGLWPRIVTIIISGVLLLFLASWASGWTPHRFLVGADNRVSNSKCQVVLWFGTAVTIYLTTLMLRLVELNWELVGGIAIPPNVLALTGLSGLTFAGAKMITVTKNNGQLPAASPGNAVPVAPPGTVKQKAVNPNWRKDLFTNDQGELDFGDFQMILITWLAVIIYLVSAYLALGNLPLQENVSLPDVDGSLLAAFGVGQGAYLAKKAAVPVGTG